MPKRYNRLIIQGYNPLYQSITDNVIYLLCFDIKDYNSKQTKNPLKYIFTIWTSNGYYIVGRANTKKSKGRNKNENY